jgi:acetyl esterase/lipase
MIKSWRRVKPTKQDRIICEIMSMRKVLQALWREVTHPHVITRILSRLIPLGTQRSIRDSGLFRGISDFLSAVLAGMFVLYEPRLLINYLKLSKQVTVKYYGDSPSHYLDLIDMKGYSEQGNLDTQTDPSLQQDKVLVFVHGGAWGSGAPWMYRFCAYGLAYALDVNYVAVVGYPVYPQATILEQATHIVAAVTFLQTKASSNCIPENALYILSGHSSGANVSFLACWISAVQHNRKLVDLFIGLSGVYDLVKHNGYEANRGVAEISPMTAAAGGYDLLHSCSPSLMLQRSAEVNTTRAQLEMHLPPSVVIHGTDDTTVPVYSTVEFEEGLIKWQLPVCSDYYKVRLIL